MNYTETLIIIVTSILGSSVITAAVNKIKSESDKAKTKAEIESIVAATYKDMIKSLREEIDRLEGQVKRMYERETNYLLQNASLVSDKQDLLSRIQIMEKDWRDSVRKAESLKIEVQELKAKINKP